MYQTQLVKMSNTVNHVDISEKKWNREWNIPKGTDRTHQ
jgi:hypothetical protein